MILNMDKKNPKIVEPEVAAQVKEDIDKEKSRGPDLYIKVL